MQEVYEYLKCRAEYALNGKLKCFIYEEYGEASMAKRLGAITSEQFNDLYEMLVVNGLNNPKAGLK